MTGRSLDNSPTSRRNGRPRGYIENYRPSGKTRDLLTQVAAVIEEYRDHLPLTVRQVFYRLVGTYRYDKTEPAYRNLSHHLSNARNGRWIDFDAIRDDGVATYLFEHFADKDHFLSSFRRKAAGYRRDRMANQSVYIEVCCEAAGMLQQLSRVTERYSIKCYSSSGFDSTTAKYDTAQRICKAEKPAIILHLGDFDPSGVALFDNVAECVTNYVQADRPHGSCSVEYQRVALTADQVIDYGLETSPPKPSDSRSRHWRDATCQLEALPPDVISQLLDRRIARLIDPDRLAADLDHERHERDELTRLLLSGPGQA